jgi:hypothetical protein
MRKFLFVLASMAILAMVSPAVAQYVLPPPGVGPGYIAPGYTNRGYRWREQRLYEDPRRNNYIVQERQPSENYERTLPTERRAITDPGECAIGVSEETCRRRGQKYNPPRQD